MEQKPMHYDGSGQIEHMGNSAEKKPVEITDEMRKNISGNTYEIK